MFDFSYICRPAFCISLTINHPYIASYNSDSNNDIVIIVLHVWSLYQHISCHNNESNDHVTLMTFPGRAGWEREGCLRVCWTGCLGLSALQWINIIQVQEGARFPCCVFNVLTLFDRQEGWSFRGGPNQGQLSGFFSVYGAVSHLMLKGSFQCWLFDLPFNPRASKLLDYRGEC